MWLKSPPKATGKRLLRQSARGSNEAPGRCEETHASYQGMPLGIPPVELNVPALAAEVRLRPLLQRCNSPLRQRRSLAGRIFFLHLLVNLFGLIRLLPRLVEACEFKLRGSFADD